MASVDLVFSRPYKSGNPVDLVFGDDGGSPGVPDAHLLVAARMPGLRGRVAAHVGKGMVASARMPGLRSASTIRYNTNTPRPMVARVQSVAQQAAAIETGWISRWQKSSVLPAGWAAAAQDAQPLRSHTGLAWQEAQPRGQAVKVQYQQAQRNATGAHRVHWQDGVRARMAMQARAEDARRAHAAVAVRFEETLRDRRVLMHVDAQDAMGLQLGMRFGAGPARPLYLAHQARYQKAMRPPAGRSAITPPRPPDPEHCWQQLVGGPIELLFCKPWSASADLVFFCCKSRPPEPGGQYVIPLLRVYMLVYEIDAVLLPTGERVLLSDVRIESGDDGFGWTLSASGPVHLVDQLAYQAGLPRHIKVSINGIEWVFAVKRPVRSRSASGWHARVSGQSVTSLLGAPYRRPQQWSIGSAMSAQQIALDALQFTGVSLSWTAPDWLVPAAAWSHEGTPLTVVKRLAEAAGAGVRSHRTDAALQVVPQYAAMPWDWAAAVPDVQMPGQIILEDSLTDLEQDLRNGVYVTGTAAGGLVGFVRRTGTQGELLATQISDPLMTDVAAVRARGSIPLADTALRWRQEITVPLITGGTTPGLILPGYLLKVEEPGETWRGLVRNITVQEKAPEVSQTLVVDRYQ
ncbi:hypothetical protein [Comamonas terrae]|uniref:Minor tail protein n=1 Tax=Comamonas terrae TaxID=673548 RepID=A0ABW5UN35_9BURK|nr:hypothetical protein [Comamonas terrae]